MKKISILFTLLIFLSQAILAQNVGVGTTTPNANAILDVSSTNKGLLLPRLADTNAITGAKPAGLMIYSNADNQIYFYNGSYWQKSAAQSATDLWYVKNDSVNYTKSKYVGINSSINEIQPQANLQVNGSILAQQSTTQSSASPTVAQTATMNNSNSSTVQVLGLDTDSVLRVFDPGGSNNNYSDNMEGNITIPFNSNTIGYQLSFDTSDFGLGIGDTLWINYFRKITNTSISPSELFVTGPYLNLKFRSNADGNINKGFAITIRRLYDAFETYPSLDVVGNTFYFNPSNGALRAGSINSTIIGDYSTAIGYQNIAEGNYSTAVGNGTSARGKSSTAMGSSSQASGDYSTAMGDFSMAKGIGSTAMGVSTMAYGNHSTAMGVETITTASGSLSIGRNNNPIVSSGSNYFLPTDPLFIIGNGQSRDSRRNAMVVYNSGNTEINGFTRLGKANEAAPAIKTKKIIGYSTPTSANPNTFTFVPHGLTASKILSVSVLVDVIGGYQFLPHSTQTGYLYTLNIDPTGGGSPNIAVGVKSAAESGTVMGRPIKIFITYEE